MAASGLRWLLLGRVCTCHSPIALPSPPELLMLSHLKLGRTWPCKASIRWPADSPCTSSASPSHRSADPPPPCSLTCQATVP